MLQALDIDINPDMTASVYGPLLMGDGIKIRIENVDVVNERCIRHWKSVCSKHGYSATIEHSSASGYVTINCQKRQNISKINVAIVALSFILVSRYLFHLW